MNNPRMNEIIDKLYERNNININEGFIKNTKELNDLSKRFQKFLDKKKFFYEEMGVQNGKLFVEVSGDWKHEHLYFNQLAKEFFDKEGHEIAMGEVVTQEDGSDNYTANHFIAVCEGVELESSNEFMNTLRTYIDENSIIRLDLLLDKYVDESLSSITMSKVDPNSEFDFEGSKLVVFVLKDGLSTDELNKGLVAVLGLSNGRVHLIDTEVFEDGMYYINTILYNMYELESMSKEVWIGDVALPENIDDWRYN